MDAVNKEKLILSLIKDDLINTCLILKLEAMGLYSDCYYLHLSSTIFELMEFDDNKVTEELFEQYIALTEKMRRINITKSNKTLERLASEIYKKLLAQSIL